MVRIKNYNDEDKQSRSMNGFTEDDEGNHECHNLQHIPDLELPPGDIGEFHPVPLETTNEAQGIPPIGTFYQEEWPMHRALWMSGPSSIGEKDPLDCFGGDDTESIMSFSSSTATMGSRRQHTHQLGTKVEMVYSLLSMLGSCNKEDMSRTLLEMSSNQDSCIAMRQSGCLPLLIQLLHGREGDTPSASEQQSASQVKWAVREARRRASQALHNIVHAHPDDRRGRREARVLRLLEQLRDYSDFLRDMDSSNRVHYNNENLDLHPGPAIAALMKLSFDEEHRHAMCQLGGLQAIAELIQAEHEIHGNTSDQFSVTVRRYAGMALTNLTFGDGTNKALLCSMKPFMQALVGQLHSPCEELQQVTASVLRNLSWRADASSKQILREVGVVTTLMRSAMQVEKEASLKSILSALWNLSAHCSMNKADICEMEGALDFLVTMLTHKSSCIVENGGGILRNISSHIAVKEEYRMVLRRHKCLQTLLAHLKSPSLTIVSNACGTLWNLSARCPEDQRALWDMGAVGMLRNLIHSRHKMISTGSSAALKNLLAARPEGVGNGHSMNGTAPNTPSLLVRKQRALETDLDEDLAETCDNIDSPKTSPTPADSNRRFVFDGKPHFLSYLPGRMYHSINGHVGSPVHVPRSESKDSLGSTRSEPPHYRAQRERFKILVNDNRTVPLNSEAIIEQPTEPKTNVEYPGNSNGVVLQMYRNLKDRAGGSAIQTNRHPEMSDSEDGTTPVRPSTLLSPRKITGHKRIGRLFDRDEIQNGLHQFESRTNSQSAACSNGYAISNVPLPNNAMLDIPGNKRLLPNGSGVLAGKRKSSIWRSNFLHHDQGSESSDQEDRFRNVVMRRKKPTDLMSSSAVILPKDAEDPNAMSRCSSLSSLTSCFQQSARSSWVSDASQRTSSVISPSDLPDSPGVEDKPRLYEFTDKLPESNAQSLIKPRPAWPANSAHYNEPRRGTTDDSFSDAMLDNGGVGSPASSRKSRFQNGPLSVQKSLHLRNASLRNNLQEESVPRIRTDSSSLNIFEERHQNALQSKINNVFSSVISSRSGIPVKSKLSQSFPENSDVSNDNMPASSSLQSSQCDDNDNVTDNNGDDPNAEKQKSKVGPQTQFVSQEFLSKCLSVCKKYPALSHKSSFEQAGKIKTAIPQVIRAESTSLDGEHHPKQLQIKSQTLPIYKGPSESTNITHKTDSKATTQGNSSSTEDNISEDNILSSSPSPCDESEGLDSDEKVLASGGRPGEQFLRNNRPRSKKSKLNRRSMEIRPPSEQSSEDDNKSVFVRMTDASQAQLISHFTSVPSSESEEKVKEDQKTKEKVSRGVIPDLLAGAAYHDGLDHELDPRSRAVLPRNMTDSMELRRDAMMIAAELEDGLEDYTHSSTSFDLDNMKPPSYMAEMSMTSSGLSDLLSNGNGCYINGKRAVDRRRSIKRSKKISSRHQFVLKSVRQTIAKNLDAGRHIDKPISASTSLENVSVKSSGTSDLIENINPPSILDELSMTNSCASLNSISSDILESRSQSLADPRSNSEMFQRLNAAAAMVQVYSRELSNIMTGSMKSSYNSDCLDLVKPPSIFQDIAEVTVEDGTEILTDPLVSDFELEEDLPHDDEPTALSTVQSPFAASPRCIDSSVDNLNSSVDGDSLVDRHLATKRISTLAMDHHSRLKGLLNSQSLATDDDHSSGFYSNITTEDHGSLDRNDSLDTDAPSSASPTIRHGPRIVKPINRETVRQMQEKKIAEQSAKSVRGFGPRNLLQQVTSARAMSSFSKTGATKTSPPSVSAVRPTRTSALRASQNKQANAKLQQGRRSPRQFLSRPPQTSRSSISRVNKPTEAAVNSVRPTSNGRNEPRRPALVKQNTFTKDEPKVPMSSMGQLPDEQNNNGNACGGLSDSQQFQDSKIAGRRSFPPTNASYNMQRKHSMPIQRRTNAPSGIPKSPSAQSMAFEDKSLRKVPEKSPSSNLVRGCPVQDSKPPSTKTSSVSLSFNKPPRDVPSKVSSFWKRSESSSSEKSPVTEGSANDKPFPSNVTKNVAARSSSVATSSTQQQKGLSRSSTYDKLSKPTANLNDSSKQPNRPAPRKPVTAPKSRPSIFSSVAKKNTWCTFQTSGRRCPNSETSYKTQCDHIQNSETIGQLLSVRRNEELYNDRTTQLHFQR